MPNKISDQIKYLITNSGKSRYQIAKDAGITGSTLQRVVEPDWGNQLVTAEKVLNALQHEIVIKKVKK